MTTLELKVNLSDRLAREAQAAGGKPLSMDEIQAEVDAVRKARRGWRQAVEKRQVLQLLDVSIERGYLKHQVEESHAQGVARVPQCPRRTP